MSMSRGAVDDDTTSVGEQSGPDLVRELVAARPARVSAVHASRAPSVAIGMLVGLVRTGNEALVVYPDQPGSAALHARSVVDLHDRQIGREVVLMFANGDPQAPIVMGVLRDAVQGAAVPEEPGHVEVEADGGRLVVSARQQVVLRCGQASITLTSAGKVLIEGTYVVTRSSGVNRIKGGCVQIN